MDEQTKIALMEQKIDNFATIVSKLDNTIEKLSEVNANVIKMLAVHEEKVSHAEKTDDYILKLIEEKSKKIDSIEEELKEVQRTRWMTVGVGSVLIIIFSSFGQQIITKIFHPPVPVSQPAQQLPN